MKKRTKNRIADVREKRARFASGLARSARSARLRFCLFRRFVFIQGVCLSRRAQRADLFKDKHTPKCHLRFFVDILKLWVIVTLSLSNITSRTKAFTISFRTGYPVYLTKSPVQVTLYLVGVKERVTALFLLLNTEA